MSAWRSIVETLFVAHRRQLIAMVRKQVGNPDIAADLVQDVFTRVLTSGSKGAIDDDRRILFASARNAALEYHRSENRRARLMDGIIPEQRITHEPSPELGMEAKEALRALDRALAGLSPRCRDIFLLRRVHGLSNAEIAERQGISINSVEKHIARALRHCQIYLADPASTK